MRFVVDPRLMRSVRRAPPLRSFLLRCVTAIGVVIGVVLGVMAVGQPARAELPGVRAALAAGDCKAAGAAINDGLARNEAEAYFYAGLLYDESGCVAQDPAHAARLYRRAIELGDVDAAPYLGLLYAMGRGVPQDYAMAHRAYHGDKAAADDAAMSPAELAALGYAETLARIAIRKVSYPPSANSNGIEALFDVLLTPGTGKVEFVTVRIGTEIGGLLPRTHDFTDQIEAAYRDAIAQAPRPASSTDAPIRIDTPWQFAMRRSADNRKVRLEGYVDLGESRIAR